MIICPVCTTETNDRVSVCPVCGFKMKGSTQQFKPVNTDMNDLEQSPAVAPANEPAPVPAPATIPANAPAAAPIEYVPDRSMTLKVIRGPRTGVDIVVSQKEYSIGRDPKCDIFLNDMTVSRLHATIIPDGNCYKIIDEKSFNGVWINNRNITESVLRNGDVVQIGTFCLQVVF